LAHPYWEFAEHGYEVDIYNPDGGKLAADNWSHPRHESKYSAHDLISLGFLSSLEHVELVENSKPIKRLKIADYDALFVGAMSFVGVAAPASSGGFSDRNDLYRSKSYATFTPPPTSNGAEKVRICIITPPTPEPMAQNKLRARFVIPLAKVRSLGFTSAAT